MKVVLSWISDPCVHLIVIGLVLMRLVMGTTAASEPGEIVVHCPQCGTGHDLSELCPTLTIKPFALAGPR